MLEITFMHSVYENHVEDQSLICPNQYNADILL